jgi:hypothetical protein
VRQLCGLGGTEARHRYRLNHVFRLPQVADEGQRVAEGHVLEAPGEVGEGVEIASCRGPHQRFRFIALLLDNKCRDRVVGFARRTHQARPAVGVSYLLP